MTLTTPDRLHCLEEEHWALIEDSFPRAKGNKGFQPEISNREVLEAVIYRSRTGCPWRDLPKEYGYWHAIYMRWTRWIKDGVMQRALNKLHAQKEAAGEISPALVFVDSTIVRAHQHAAGAKKKPARKRSGARAGD